MAHAAAVFAGADVQPQVQARLNAPVAAVGGQHGRGRQRGGGPGTEQILRVDLVGGAFVAVKTTRQPGRLRHEGELDGLRRGGKGDQAARLQAAAI